MHDRSINASPWRRVATRGDAFTTVGLPVTWGAPHPPFGHLLPQGEGNSPRAHHRLR
ncbi:hypothetical protein XFF6992_560019 [Xanthomonas citri pv. fuscans]|nr:hypothetical protein XFF6992_560019 [Xanthomonas citri pv. fuscans]SOO35576.1 hypothetical protein XFF6994_5460011 [Xanthomonas citri pv. fuscans]